MEDTIGLGFHSHRDAITGVASSTKAAALPSIDDHQHATRFVSSSDSKPPPPHPSMMQQSIQSNDNHRSLLYSSQTQQYQPDMHQNNALTNPQHATFQPPPGLPPPLSIPSAIAVPPPSQLPPPPAPIEQPIIQQQPIIQSQQQNDSIAKARAIAQRFHIESTQPSHSFISSSSSSSMHNQQHPTSFIHNSNSIHDLNNYAQKRQIHFQNEKLKLQSATLKNLEYIMKHEESQLRSHVDCMNEMTEWGERQEVQLQLMRDQQHQQQRRQQQQQQQEEQKQQRQMERRSGGGIGSSDQRYVERVRKRRQFGQVSNTANTSATNQKQSQQSSPKRTSIYLTNLPTDGSITERTLRSLFCTYGHLDRVTMYRNRSTGELKGDGLIVFGFDAINSHNNVQEEEVTNNNGESGVDLVETVCMQMNGAELPCGTVIGVEPADMDWGSRKKDKKVEMDCHHASTAAITTSSSGDGEDVKESKEETMKGNDEEEELDDFFASLE